MTVAASAAAAKDTYSDWASVQHKDAVDLLTQLGAVKGTDLGTYNPTGNLTRAEAATLFMRVHANPSVTKTNPIEKIEATFKGVAAAKFTDVAVDSWYAGAIGYGVSNGYFAGTTDTTYEPDGKITLVQVAKVLLCALGYNATTEGFVGNTMIERVTALASANGLYAGIDASNPNGAISRDDFAQMVANFLGANMVTYATGVAAVPTSGAKSAMLNYYQKTAVKTTGYVVKNSYAGALAGFRDAYNVTGTGSTGTVVAVPGKCAGTGLCVIAHQATNAGCPGNTYTLVATAAVTGYAEFGQEVTIIEIYNGSTATGTPISTVSTVTGTSAVEDVYANGAINKVATLKAAAKSTAPGTLINQYVNARHGQVPGRMTEIADATDLAARATTGAGYLTKLYDFTGDKTAELALIIEEKLATVSAVGTPDATTGVVTYTVTGTTIASDKIYGDTTLAAGDVFTYYQDDAGLFYINVLTSATGKLTALLGLTGSDDATGVKIGTTDYTFSKVTTADLAAATKANVGSDVKYYLDKGGYVVKMNVVTETPDTATILLYAQSGATFWTGSSIKGIDKDGNSKTYTFASDAKLYSTTAASDSLKYNTLQDMFNAGVRYVTATLDGTVIKSTVPASNAQFVNSGAKTLLTGSLVIGSTNPSWPNFDVDSAVAASPVVSANNAGYVNDDTIFMFRTTTANAVGTAYTKTYYTETVKVVVGVKNIATEAMGDLDVKEVVYADESGAAAVVVVDLGTVEYVAIPSMVYGAVADVSGYSYFAKGLVWEYTGKDATTTKDLYTVKGVRNLKGDTFTLEGVSKDVKDAVDGAKSFGVLFNTSVVATLNAGQATGGTSCIVDVPNEGAIASISLDLNRIAYVDVDAKANTVSTKGATIIVATEDGTFELGSLADVAVGDYVAYANSFATTGGVRCATQAANIVIVVPAALIPAA